jgi:hypothetical protein
MTDKRTAYRLGLKRYLPPFVLPRSVSGLPVEATYCTYRHIFDVRWRLVVTWSKEDIKQEAGQQTSAISPLPVGYFLTIHSDT